MKQRHVVITGGAGFIGTHFSAACLARGLQVTVLTRHTDSPRALQLARQGVRVLPCDLSRPERCSLPPDMPQGPSLVHLAADVSVHGSGVWATNVEGTRRALELADAMDASHVTVASSIEAQGMSSEAEGPLSEEAPCRPVSDYGRSKLQAEELATEWGHRSGKPLLVLRIGNIYGPGSAWLLEPTLSALLNPDQIRPVWSQLKGRRFQPLYIADLIEAMGRTAESMLTGLYHLTGEASVTLEHYAYTLARLVGMASQLPAWEFPAIQSSAASRTIAPDFAYMLMGDPAHSHRCYDNRKLCATIGPYARWSLSRGLAATLQWYCAMRGWSVSASQAA